MERDHVVVDLGRFLELQKKADELARLKNDCFILSKEAFTLYKSFDCKKVGLKIDSNTAETIARELFTGSEFEGDYEESFKGGFNDKYEVGDFYLSFNKKGTSESEDEE